MRIGNEMSLNRLTLADVLSNMTPLELERVELHSREMHEILAEEWRVHVEHLMQDIVKEISTWVRTACAEYVSRGQPVEVSKFERAMLHAATKAIRLTYAQAKLKQPAGISLAEDPRGIDVALLDEVQEALEPFAGAVGQPAKLERAYLVDLLRRAYHAVTWRAVTMGFSEQARQEAKTLAAEIEHVCR